MSSTSHKRIKVCILVLNRSEYSRLKRLIITLKGDKRFTVSTVVLQSPYSNNRILFERDGIQIDEVVKTGFFTRQTKDTSKTMGVLLKKFGEVFHRLDPDIVVVHGDRYEAMAAVLAGTLSNVFIAHLQGGEITGTIDEHFRHAITKLSHLHLPSTTLAAERIVKLGENASKVLCVGCPGIDLLLDVPRLSISELRYELYKVTNNRTEVLDKFNENYFLVMQSPVTTEFKEASNQIGETLEALAEFSDLKIVLLPNPDAGGDDMQEEILKFTKGRVDFLVFKHFPPEIFTNLLVSTRVMIGNSSAGIRESGYFGIPTVNIGTRQTGRERSNNILDVGYDRTEISRAIRSQLQHGLYDVEMLYGQGDSAKKISDVLADIDYTQIQKHLAY